MADRKDPSDYLLEELQERAKELHCLYRVDEILSGESEDDDAYRALLEAIPPGWKYPDICQVRIDVGGATFQPEDFADTPWILRADVAVHGESVGAITVSYREERPAADEGPFLREERRLIDAIAERLGLHLMQRRLRADRESWERVVQRLPNRDSQSLRVLVDFLMRADRELLHRIARKMINHLCWNGVAEAAELLHEGTSDEAVAERGDENRPQRRQSLRPAATLIERTFQLASRHLDETEIVSLIQGWITEDKCVFLVRALESPSSTLNEIAEAVLRYRDISFHESDLSVALQTSLRVGLLRRFFVPRPEFMQVAKRYVEIKDFYDLVDRIVYSPESHGKLGGKASGLFLAEKILSAASERDESLRTVRVPRTWYVASDAVLDFIEANQLNEVYERKYMDIERVRRDYPLIVQVFKNSSFTHEVTTGLAAILDQVEKPLIVRSSSMLEDRAGASFAGKYKSLFLANQGTKRERLAALQDAIAEVWASVFGPDPIEYRAERGLLDFREEMAILIQEVVGTRIGNYFLPAYAGVAFSSNEYRWSPRLAPEDGLVRIVPGLGTRAVDRMSDDYPVLVSPGKPGLRPNVTADEVLRYSPKCLDVINLETNAFESIDIAELLRAHGDELPEARRLVSLVDGDRLREPLGLEPDWEADEYAVTFEGLFNRSEFLPRMATVLRLLSGELGTPVDVEFASDGTDLYILQCRAQSRREEHRPAPIPHDLDPERVLFTAHRYITNGRVAGISHLVYVDPAGYEGLETRKELLQVARAVGRLNALLPRRRFVLIGPGRWGSRGDIKLGVGVTYSDIGNTAMLIEMARQKGTYAPEPSFGTHFFLDLVEADIRYLPLYPDEPDTIFRHQFFTESPNLLADLAPEFAKLSETVKVIDLSARGETLEVLMNADAEQAVGVLTPEE
ncbi:MAG: PEP/pyruvate-binding domain-containing protein [Gemmatimonadales bacterium]|jgi:hypothetical protein